MPHVVQFTHPGQEHGPNRGSKNHKSWNTGAHKRKFLAARGQYVNGDSLVDVDLMFWGEWEPCSRVEDLNLPGLNRALPEWLHHPLWPCPENCRLPGVVANGKSDGRCAPVKAYRADGTCKGNQPHCQNTDPYVFGDCFKYFSCKQVRHKNNARKEDEVNATKLANLDPGSIILLAPLVEPGRMLASCWTRSLSLRSASNMIRTPRPPGRLAR